MGELFSQGSWVHKEFEKQDVESRKAQRERRKEKEDEKERKDKMNLRKEIREAIGVESKYEKVAKNLISWLESDSGPTPSGFLEKLIVALQKDVKNGSSLKVLENESNVETWITSDVDDPIVKKLNKAFPATNRILNSMF